MMYLPSVLKRAALSAACCLPATGVMATNGMNMEGYGPIATGMGGASMAYDNGNAALMNNPATLGLMDEGNRAELFFGVLGPDVKAEAGGMSAHSHGTAYYMPAGGWIRKRDRFSYGIGVFGQGGMGTDYSGNTFLGDPAMTGANLENRTELSVGRVLVPLVYEVNDKFNFGGTVDFVWAGLDLKMAMSAAQFGELFAGNTGTVSGSMLGALPPAALMNLQYAYYDFSNGNDFTGEANAYGYAGKLGFTYKVNDKLSVGATYHSKTRLNNLKTNNADVRIAVAGMGEIPISGKMTVDDFQWPATWAVGMRYQPVSRLMLVADIKRLLWEDVMENFTLQFEADQNQSNPGAAAVAGTTLDATMFQDWQDQWVYQVGGAYQVSHALTLRLGYNYGKNPVPGRTLNPLFPGIVEKHLTGGLGYAFNDHQSFDFSVVRGFNNSDTNPGNGSTVPPVEASHDQLNYQFQYTHLF